ncbi:MAG TPA: contractile injection system tape measure protein, partial [Bacteroidia bacterium]|nr:contractile injection system tape measure protein [Bacteroidia bacterium]
LQSTDDIFNNLLALIKYSKNQHVNSLTNIEELTKPAINLESLALKAAFVTYVRNAIEHQIAFQVKNLATETPLGESKQKKTPDFKKTKDESLEEGIMVHTCGIVLLHPFILNYFKNIGIYTEGGFKSSEDRLRAPLLLHYVATGNTTVPEFELVLQKLLCGIETEEAIPNTLELTEQEVTESDNLLNTVLEHWAPLNRTSIEGLRTTFLQREGKLNKIDTGWKLNVENKTVDVLLNKLPWGYSMIKLPWMKDILTIEWN